MKCEEIVLKFVLQKIIKKLREVVIGKLFKKFFTKITGTAYCVLYCSRKTTNLKGKIVVAVLVCKNNIYLLGITKKFLSKTIATGTVPIAANKLCVLVVFCVNKNQWLLRISNKTFELLVHT